MDQKLKKSYRYQVAQKRIKDIKSFYVHLLVYLFINIAILIVNTRGEGFLEGIQDINNYFTALFWGVGLVAHWCSVFAPNLFLGKKWEERKIQEILEKKRQQTWE